MAKIDNLPLSLTCSTCLDTLKSPVTLHCGHSFCMVCVNSYWDQEAGTLYSSGVYSCPHCRHTFTTRPVLNKNTILADLAEKICCKLPKEDEVRPGSVECDFCTVKKLKAVKSCLVCLASYCATHLQPHYESAAFKRHKLVEVSASIQDRICSKHDKLLEVYCRSDDQFICLLCVMDEHKAHDTVSAAAERKEKQKQFGKKKQRHQQRVQEKEKQLLQLRQKVKELQCHGDAAVDQNEKTLAEIVMVAKKRRDAVNDLIKNQEKAAVSQAETLMDQLEKEISDLRKREDELKQLTLTEDHIHFLQSYHSIFDQPDSDISFELISSLHTRFDFVTKAISDLRDKTEDMAKSMAELYEEIQANSTKTRQELSLYSCHLSLDPSTAFVNLLLSERNSKVTWVKRAQTYPYCCERFTNYEQVLCAEGLSGVCYWEVMWQGPRVEVAMCYKGAELDENGFGFTDQSWCISLSNSGCAFWHSAVKTKISTPCSSTVGVYLNHQAGSLSFYTVSGFGEMTLLHSVQATFTQPLYPGFMVSRGSSIKIMSLK